VAFGLDRREALSSETRGIRAGKLWNIMKGNKQSVILLAEDNVADQNLTKRAFQGGKLSSDLRIVEDGVEALEYLKRRGKYSNPASSPRPDILLLDINMPRMDGKQLLKEIKDDPDLKIIPIIMLTTSRHEVDVLVSYTLGVNAYITKPVDVDRFLETIRGLEHFWLTTVMLPPNGE